MKIENKFFKNWILFVAILLAAVLRLWNLGSIPPSLTQDEAALGYNAYSILKNGKDEYGESFPILFKSFGDYKPGLYVYLDVPFIAVLSLNEVSTRLPSAIAGVVSVYLIYLIVKKLFANQQSLPAISAFIAATNPWLIYLSRGAWEVNVALTFTLVGIYFFLKSLEKGKHLLLAAIFFGLTILTYQGAKLSTLIVLVILLAVYWKDFWKINLKYLITSFGIGVLISLPVFISLFNGKVGRLDVFSIFSYPRSAEYIQTFLNEGGEKVGGLTYYIFHSEALNFTRGILGRYFNHFSARFLFFDGDYQNPQHSAPYQGMLLLSDILLFPLGLFFLIKSELIKPRAKAFIIAWLLLSPLPAVLSRDQVQSVRALNMSIPLIVMLSLGFSGALELLNKRFTKYAVAFVVFLFYLLPFAYFADAYFLHVPKHNSNYWNYGYREVVDIVSEMQSEYQDIYVQQSYAQPYIYFLFYQKYDPATYQSQAKLARTENSNDVGFVERIDNINFSQIDWSALQNKPGSLVVIDGVTSIPESLSYETIASINYLNKRDLAFKIIEIK